MSRLILGQSVREALRAKQRGFIINPYAHGSSGPATDFYFGHVLLLLKAEGVDGSTSISDLGGLNVSCTMNNGAQIDTAQFKFGASSILFDGTDDNVTMSDDPIWSMGTKNFTFECWLRVNSVGAGGQGLFGQWAGAGSRAWGVNYNNSSLQFFYTTDGSTQTVFTKSWTPTTNTWYHIAVCRNGADIQLFVDGTQLGTTSNIGASTSIANVTGNVVIGGNSTIGFVNGWMDEVRFTIGFARYTSNFTAPTETFPTTWSDPHFANVKSLLHFDGVDGSTTFTDVTGRSWTQGGNAQIDTAQSKYGGASGLFDGNDDQIHTASGSDFDFSGDFTIEFWIRSNSLATQQTFFNADGANSVHVAHQIKTLTTGAIATYLAKDANPVTFFQVSTGASAITTGAWFHFAWVKSGSNARLYVNGVENGSSAGAYSAAIEPPVSSREVRIGNYYDGSEDYNGWLDDFRYTKGVARYTTGFQYPTMAYPNAA